MTRTWRSMLVGFLALLVALVFSPTTVEAKNKCRTRCRSVSVCRSTVTTVTTKTVTKTSCTGSACPANATVIPSQANGESTAEKGWYEAALKEAMSGAPNSHHYSASQIAAMAGRPGASVFVGVGYNGTTCTTSRGTLVAEANHGSKTVRIWLR